MRATLPILAAALAAAATPSASAARIAPSRIASLNVCADQYAVAFADPARVMSLSPYAADPAMSALAQSAARYRRNDGQGESLLLARPDLALAGLYDPRARRDMLARSGIPMVYVAPWSSFQAGEQQIRALATALNAAAAGEDLIARIEAALGRLRGAAPRRMTALRVHRRLFVEAGASWVGEMIAAAGLVDLAKTGEVRAGLLSAEEILAARPDLLILTEAETGDGDLGAALLAHPALARLFPAGRRIILPAALAVCEGPSTPALIDAFGAELRAKLR